MNKAKTGVPRAHLDDYLDFQLIVLATRRIYRLIYLPFILLLFLVLARSSIFDAMDFPLALIFIMGLALAYALYTAILLRRSAEAARAKALDHYTPAPLSNAAQGQPIARRRPRCDGDFDAHQRGADQTADGTDPQHTEGAFAPFTQQPALQALLLPFGGYGGVQLVEYLINL